MGQFLKAINTETRCTGNRKVLSVQVLIAGAVGELAACRVAQTCQVLCAFLLLLLQRSWSGQAACPSESFVIESMGDTFLILATSQSFPLRLGRRIRYFLLPDLSWLLEILPDPPAGLSLGLWWCSLTNIHFGHTNLIFPSCVAHCSYAMKRKGLGQQFLIF